MRLILPSFKILPHLEYATMLSIVCQAISSCYKAPFPATQKEREAFIQARIKAGHETVLEHVGFSVNFIVDRGITHEMVRHRISSFTQECVVGDTVVHPKGKTIRELWNRQQSESCHDKTHLKTIRLRSVDDSGRIIPNRLIRVFRRDGPQQVYRITTHQGYSLVCTAAHELLSPDGRFYRLEELTVGDMVMVNGRLSLLAISDEVLAELYEERGQSPSEIAEAFDVPYNSVRRRLKQLGIFVKHKNDKDPAKYNKNHTAASIEKMRTSILSGYLNGRRVWNKGLTEDDHLGVARRAVALRENHHNNQLGAFNSNWKNGIGAYRRYKAGVNCCELCGEDEGRLEVHHRDSDRGNNSLENLVKVCMECHNRLHHGWHVATKAVPDIIASIESMGIEEVFDLEMDGPLHNYVANGFLVHNSTRYCDYSKGKFGGHVTFIMPPFIQALGISEGEYTLVQTQVQSRLALRSTNSEEILIAEDQRAAAIWLQAMDIAETCYLESVANREKGQLLPPEMARGMLPNSLKTEICWTANMREWRWIFSLRALGKSGRPHPQMTEVMAPLLEEIKQRFPIFFSDLTV